VRKLLAMRLGGWMREQVQAWL
jgi:hypothetical protein